MPLRADRRQSGRQAGTFVGPRMALEPYLMPLQFSRCVTCNPLARPQLTPSLSYSRFSNRPSRCCNLSDLHPTHRYGCHVCPTLFLLPRCSSASMAFKIRRCKGKRPRRALSRSAAFFLIIHSRPAIELWFLVQTLNLTIPSQSLFRAISLSPLTNRLTSYTLYRPTTAMEREKVRVAPRPLAPSLARIIIILSVFAAAAATKRSRDLLRFAPSGDDPAARSSFVPRSFSKSLRPPQSRCRDGRQGTEGRKGKRANRRRKGVLHELPAASVGFAAAERNPL